MILVVPYVISLFHFRSVSGCGEGQSAADGVQQGGDQAEDREVQPADERPP